MTLFGHTIYATPMKAAIQLSVSILVERMYVHKEILANQEEYNKKMESLFERLKDKVVAVGECGLDYDRLEYSDVETQLRFGKKMFPYSLRLGPKIQSSYVPSQP